MNATRSMSLSSRQKRKSCNKDSRRGPWASLLPDLLIRVLMQLTFVDFCACLGVCKEWRSIALDYRSTFYRNQQPLAVVKSKFGKRGCFLQGINGETRYKTLLPGFTRWLLGFSCCYLIMLNRNREILLVNLFTRHEICFTEPLYWGSFITKAILFYSEEVSDSLLLLISKQEPNILLSQCSSPDWHNVLPVDSNYKMHLDVAFFNGCVFVLTNGAEIGELRLQYETTKVTKRTTLRLRHHSISYSNVKINIPKLLLSPLHLVASNDHLLMVSYVQQTEGRVIAVHKLDEKLMEWIQVNDLGEDALFLSEGSSAAVNTTKWGGFRNLIYILPKLHNEWYLYSLGTCNNYWSECRGSPVIGEEGSPLQPYFWCFPHQIDDRNCLKRQEEAVHS